MNQRKTLLTASVVAALSILASNAACAAGPLMAAPVNLASPQETAGLVAKLTALDARRGIGSDNSFRIASQHPGVVGEKIVRENPDVPKYRYALADVTLQSAANQAALGLADEALLLGEERIDLVEVEAAEFLHHWSFRTGGIIPPGPGPERVERL